MKKWINMWVLSMTMALVILPLPRVNAEPIAIIGIIKAAVKKVIRAMDLQVQRLQNKTIWLQNAQKTLENALSKIKLEQIADWTDKQKEQYRKYYEELMEIKAAISYYQRIREIINQQVKMVDAYNKAWSLVKNDKHFTADETSYMAAVYSGILAESMRNIEQINMLLQSFTTSMSDAGRLELINKAADQVESNYNDLLLFNRQNAVLSLQRARTAIDAEIVKKLYGLH